MNRLLLKNATLVTGLGAKVADVMIEGGKIAQIAPAISGFSSSDRIIDLKGKMLSYGFADVHVHFREPGFSYKETIATGSAAAARGGYTCVCTMPNLEPAPDSLENVALQQRIIERDAVIDVRPFASITKSRAGEEAVEAVALAPVVAGFSDDGCGVQSCAVMKEAMERIAEAGSLVSAHCEDTSAGDALSESAELARNINLSARTGCRLHACHLSTKESMVLMRQAKERGLSVSCETAPHYLLFSTDDVKDEGRFKMNPPIGTPADHNALIAALQDGIIDAIATDHAPHSEEEKSRGFKKSLSGIVGLETAFAACYTGLVLKGVISLERLIDLLCDAPRRIFGLGGALEEGQSADLTVFDLDREYVIDPEEFATKGRSCPFTGMKVRGRCLLTLYRGEIVYSEI